MQRRSTAHLGLEGRATGNTPYPALSANSHPGGELVYILEWLTASSGHYKRLPYRWTRVAPARRTLGSLARQAIKETQKAEQTARELVYILEWLTASSGHYTRLQYRWTRVALARSTLGSLARQAIKKTKKGGANCVETSAVRIFSPSRAVQCIQAPGPGSHFCLSFCTSGGLARSRAVL